MRSLVIGTRGSLLALRQTRIVQGKLETLHSGVSLSTKQIVSRADQRPDVPLEAVGGEGVFVKELETALQAREIDLAVHSLKDLPLDPPPGLRIGAILERDDPRDALVARSGETFDRLASQARVGTSSLRRRTQLQRRRPDVTMEEIRGNVDTRLRKLDEGRYDAIVVAACGLIRLGLEERISEYLDVSLMVPEPGQGALAIEVRAEDAEVVALVRGLDHGPTRACVEAERAFLGALGGGCRVPIAAYGSAQGESLTLEGIVCAPDGSRSVRGRLSGGLAESVALGKRLAAQLAAQGAKELLKATLSTELG